jgi:hypothetical protein
MKRFLMALAVLFTATASPTFAGYVIIRVLLESAPENDTGSHGPGNVGPGMYGGGMYGSGGFRPGTVGSSIGPPGGPKMPGGGGPPMPMGGGPMMPGTHKGEHHGNYDPSRSIVVVVPLESDLLEEKLDKSKTFNDKENPKFRKFNTHFLGKKIHAVLFVDSTAIQFYDNLFPTPAPKKTRYSAILDKHAVWERKKDPQALYDALVMALDIGLIRAPVAPVDGTSTKDAVTFAQELLDYAAEGKQLPLEADRFVKAWGPIARAVRGPAQPATEAETWKARLDARDVRSDGHYALIYWDASPVEVARRTRQLNDNFIGFYLFHAVRGNPPPVPAKQLVAVLAKQGQSMRGLHHALDGMPVQADAFYAPDHDLLVLSPERLDGVGQTFLQQQQQVFVKGLSREPLLDGLIPKLDSTGEKGPRPEDVARAATLALVEKFAFEDAEIAAVSREGTRQLLFATNQLPRFVTLPIWLSNGSVNYLARPRGPAYVTVGEEDTPYMHVALHTGYGPPNYVLRRHFTDIVRDLEAHHKTTGKLQADRDHLLELQARMLVNVLTDSYFAGLKNADDPDPALPKKHKKPDTAPAPKTGPGGGPGQPFDPSGFPKGPGGPPMPKGPGSSGGPPGGPPPGGFIPGGFGPGAPGGMQSATDEEDPVVVQRKKRERLAIKAQATAWALYYYLAREKPDLLKKYIAELDKLPRDLPIDGRTAYRTFIRVFGLSAEDGTADHAKLKTFARDWLESMSSVPTVGFDVQIVFPDPPKDTTNPMGPKMPFGSGGSGSKRPGQPGGPGGP